MSYGRIGYGEGRGNLPKLGKILDEFAGKIGLLEAAADEFAGKIGLLEAAADEFAGRLVCLKLQQIMISALMLHCNCESRYCRPE